MAYKRLSEKPTYTPNKPMNTAIYGTRLGAGKHKTQLVSIRSMDDVYTLTFKNSHGETHAERVWKFNQAKTDLSYRYKQLISSLAQDPEELQTLTYAGLDNSFLGTYLNIELTPSDGYTTVLTMTGCEAHVDGKVVETALSVGALDELMRDRHISKSYLNVTKFSRSEEADGKEIPVTEASSNATTDTKNVTKAVDGGGREPLPSSRKFF